MQNPDKSLAEESLKIQRLREKLKQQLESIELRVIERTLKNKNVKSRGVSKSEVPTQILSIPQDLE